MFKCWWARSLHKHNNNQIQWGNCIETIWYFPSVFLRYVKFVLVRSIHIDKFHSKHSIKSTIHNFLDFSNCDCTYLLANSVQKPFGLMKQKQKMKAAHWYVISEIDTMEANEQRIRLNHWYSRDHLFPFISHFLDFHNNFYLIIRF